ncbi:ABC transporter permease subunit [Iningainema sp. BLCCT55]|uniref:ABC transporter permease subunit n=2 Tax=Iningainema TaxID=1932705 RepID=A0A8J7CF67_9CYAN|nr:ABC transporter permease subunit [Iningainema tapete BLCC-T55]
MGWWRWCLVFGLCCLLVLGGCGLNGDVGGGRRLVVATEPTFPPFEFQSGDGKLQGFDIDLMNAIANAAGFEVRYQNMPFAGMIPALQARSIDAAVSAMTITEERAKTISFSRPYFKSGLGIVVGENQDVSSFEGLRGKRIAVQIGTTGANKVKELAGAVIRTFDDAPTALQELLNGNVDAVVHDQAVLLYGIKTGNLGGLKLVGQLLTQEYYGIPMPKNSPNLALINSGLTKVLGNGSYAQIYKKWFNSEPPALPEKLPFQQEGSQPGVSKIFSAITVILRSLPFLLQGALVTLQITALSVVLGLVGGSLLGIVRLSRVTPVRWAARGYVDFFRGTPLLVQIFMIYFGIPAIAQELGFTFTFNRLAAAVIALSLNSAAYIGEIVRGGIQSIEVGQAEAAQSLGLSSTQTMRYVIFPQAFRRMLPPLSNEFISMLKDTSLVAVIGFEELFRKGQLIVAENYRAFEIYAAVALVYLFLTLLSSQAFSRLEVWLNPVRRSRKV